MKRLSLALFIVFTAFTANAQSSELPYYTIPDYPESYSQATLVSRMIDGLGFRYYWATEGLRNQDLYYTPGNESRNIITNCGHIHDLAVMVHNAVMGKPNVRPQKKEDLGFTELRKRTLTLLKEASDYLKENDQLTMDGLPIVFQRGEKKSEVPFWNLLNGPLADALWHTGQVVAFRRASGNPLPQGVNVFMGSKK